MADRVQVIFGADDTEFRDKLGRVEKSLNKFSDSVFSLGSILAGAGITAAIGSAVQAANQLERANIGLAVTARYVGTSFDAVNTAAKKLTQDGLMSVTNASQALQNLLSRGYTLEQAIDLMNRLKDSASFNRQAHLEFGESIVGATEGLKNENSVLVDNAGVTKNVSLMWKEYAAEHGKSVDKLTQAEKRQAEYNGIMKETEGQIGNAARMTETFAGAQARLNKEIFDSKAAMGTALMPVLADVAKALVPLIKGFRDFIGMYQMGIVSIAAFVDKALAVYDKGGLIGLLFSSDKRSDLKAEFARIEQAKNDQQDEIFKKLNMPEGPNIGKDTGKRRKDSIITDKPKKPKAVKEEDWRKFMADQYDMGPFNEEMMNARGEMSYGQNQQLKQSQWSDRNAGTDMMEFQGQFDSAAFDSARTASRQIELQKEAEFNAMRSAMGDEGLQLKLQQIQTEEDLWMQSWANNTSSFEEHERRKLQIQQYYNQQRQIAQVEGTAQRLAFEQASGQKQIQIVASAGAAMTQGAANTNKAMFLANKAFRLVQGGMELKAGVIKTFNSFPYPYNIGMAALHAAAGAMQLVDLASADYGSSGGASVPGGGYGAGTPSSPIVTQPVNSQQNTAPVINIHLEGAIYGNREQLDRWAEEHLAPTVKDLISRRNVDFGMQTA